MIWIEDQVEKHILLSFQTLLTMTVFETRGEEEKITLRNYKKALEILTS